MQDPNAGLKLHEMKAKGARQVTRYFTGKELLDWLITWSFASDRSEASSMATQMLRYGFFHPVRLDREEGVCVKLRNDSILSNDIADTEDATYIFVSTKTFIGHFAKTTQHACNIENQYNNYANESNY
jgi:hypothetical protein